MRVRGGVWRAGEGGGSADSAICVHRAGGRTGTVALVLFRWLNVGLLLLKSLVFLTLTHIRLVLLKWFCRMASQGRVLLFGVTGGGFKAGIRSCHAVHAPETLPVLCMG